MSDNKTVKSAKSLWGDANTSFSGCDMVVTMDVVFPGGTKFSRVIGSLQTLTYSIHMDKFPVRSVGNVNAKDYVFGPRTIAGSLIFAVFDRHFAYDMLSEADAHSTDKKQNLLMDEMPPINITVTFANEFGKNARLALYGIRIVNEGQTMSINDIYTENTYQFVATDIEYLHEESTDPLNPTEDMYAPSTYVSARKIGVAKPVLETEEPPVEKPKEEITVSAGSGSINFTYDIK